MVKKVYILQRNKKALFLKNERILKAFLFYEPQQVLVRVMKFKEP